MCGWCVDGLTFSPLFLYSIYSVLERIGVNDKLRPLEEDREVMESVWIQIKGACEKLKEETNT